MQQNTLQVIGWTLKPIIIFVIIGLQVTPLDGSSQNAHTPDTHVIRFNITPDVAPSSISWLFQGLGGGQQNLTLDPGLFRSLSEDRHSLTLAPVIPQHEGIYTLVANDSQGSGSGSITLNVQSKLKVIIFKNQWFEEFPEQN